MKCVVLSSSSKGNSTYVCMNGIHFLIDAGLGFNDIKGKLYDIGVDPNDLSFIIVTHAHSDHVRSIHSFNRVYGTKILISKNTFFEYSKSDLLSNYEYFDNMNEILGISFDKIPISHDKSGFGFVFESENVSLCYMADTGMIHSRYHEKLKNKTIYLFESNHDVLMEMNGIKDVASKIRNIGDEGHLSNEDCAKYLCHFIGENTKHVILIHISDHDNTYEMAYNVNREAIPSNINVCLAYKDKISEIIEI